MSLPAAFRRAGAARPADRRLHLRPAHRRRPARARLDASGCTSSRAAFRRRTRRRATLPRRSSRRCRRDALPVIDGLALPAFADLVDRLPRPWVALVHHPLALETGLTRAEARRPGGTGAPAARARRAGDRDQPADPARSRRLRRRGRAHRRGLPGHRSGAARSRLGRPGPGAAVRRLADAAQRAPGAAGRARRADRAGLAPDLRRQHGARSGLRAIDRRRDRPPGPAPARDAGRRARRSRRGGPSTTGPICSCCRPTTRATAWCSPKRSRAACRWSRPARARFPRPCRRCRPAGTARATRGRSRRAAPGDDRAGPARPAAGRGARRAPSPAGLGAMPSRAVRGRARRPDRERPVSGFAAAWLALREPYDHAARSAALAERFAAAVGNAPHLIDLGCGTGSNLRYLAPRIAGPTALALCRPRPRAARRGRRGLAGLGRSPGLAEPRRRRRSRT